MAAALAFAGKTAGGVGAVGGFGAALLATLPATGIREARITGDGVWLARGVGEAGGDVLPAGSAALSRSALRCFGGGTLTGVARA